jgi:ParB/RepB/Spo0J family partition protein
MTPHAPAASPIGPVPPALPVVPAAAAAPGAAEEHEVPVAEIDPEDNARKHFDPEQTRALADNIAAHGLLNAVIVYRHPQSGRFRLIAGERRWRAVQLLGWKTVRARVLKEPPDDATRRELALIDNEQRQDLSDIERGLAYLGYMAATGSTASALANKLGKHVSTVTRAVQIARKLPPDTQELVRSGKLPPFAARHLLRLPDDEAKRRFARLYCEGQVKTAAQLAAAVKNGAAPVAGGPAVFTCEEGGVRIAVTLPGSDPGSNPGQALAAAEAALRVVAKDLRDHGGRGLAHFKEFLARKALAAKKAAELQAAQNALAGHAGTN